MESKGGAMNQNAYNSYFEIDQDYFPHVNESSIESGERNDPDFWMRTYPHATFIKMLVGFEQILSRKVKRTLWIDGPFGSGKSQCAYALRRLLEVPSEKVDAYWNKYDSLKKKPDLLKNILQHKDSKTIVVASRYGSGGIRGTRQLFSKIQESIVEALKARGVSIDVAQSSRQAMIAWLEDESHRSFLDACLKGKYSSIFSQQSAEEVLTALKSTGDATDLMEKLLNLGEEEGIKAFTFDEDLFFDWIRELFQKNERLCVVFLWDEFSDFFLQNSSCLSSFQKLIELVNEAPFYFIGVTHEIGQLISQISGNKDSKKILDRMTRASIEIPDATAFELIGEAMRIKPASEEKWKSFSNDLNDRVQTARSAVKKIANLSDERALAKMFPLHPTTALALKYIAVAYRSNQRSMFDFIKEEGEGIEAFQWFIANYGPLDENPFLSVDQLWNFFYERGRKDLSREIRDILGAYQVCGTNLNNEEQRVFKTILILNAIDRELGGIESFFKASEQNLALCFEGTDLEHAKGVNLASALEKKGILLRDKFGKVEYFRSGSFSGTTPDPIDFPSTQSLATEHCLATKINLPWALKLRFESKNAGGGIRFATKDNFSKVLSELRETHFEDWEFKSIFCLARDDEERKAFGEKIHEAAELEENRDVVMIDATTPMTKEDAKEYCLEGGYAKFYAAKDAKASQSHQKKQDELVASWCKDIVGGSFAIYYQGEKENVQQMKGVQEALQRFVKAKFKLAFEFAPNLTENMIKASTCPAAAKRGFVLDGKGYVAGIEGKLFSKAFLASEKWWKDFPEEPISNIKIDLDKHIKGLFTKKGEASISEIYDWLATTYGFAKSNLYSFLTGMLLSDYARDPNLRYSDSNNAQEEMDMEKLGDAIGNYIKGSASREVRIVKQSQEERAFYELMRDVWGAKRQTTTPAQATTAIQKFLLEKSLPIRFVASQVSETTYASLAQFVEFCRESGSAQSAILKELGAQALKNKGLAKELNAALDTVNFQKGAFAYLQEFDGGSLWALKEELGADAILDDLKKKFKGVDYQFLWNEQTQDEQITQLKTEYQFASYTNRIFGTSDKELPKTYETWRVSTRKLRLSSETILKNEPELENFMSLWGELLKSTLIPSSLKRAVEELAVCAEALRRAFNEDFVKFYEFFASHLGEDKSEENARAVYEELENMFPKSEAESLVAAREKWDRIKLKIWTKKLSSLWSDKTNVASPRDWSNEARTPIFCLFPEEEYADLKRAIDAVENASGKTNAECEEAFRYLQNSTIFERIAHSETWDDALARAIFKGKGWYREYVDLDEARKTFATICEPHDWLGNPKIEAKATELLNTAYQEKGKSDAMRLIDKMTTDELKKYVVRLVEERPAVGLEILEGSKRS